MRRNRLAAALLTTSILAGSSAFAGQAPTAAAAPDIPISHRDRVYAAEQFSNTVSVIDPADNTVLGVIRLGEPAPANFSPLYRGQLLVHGMGFSPDHRTLAVVSIGSNSISFIDTATNAVKHVTYVGRAPHEAFFTPDGNEVWVTVRGENYVDVLDGATFEEKTRITVPNGPGMQIFSPDGKYGYVCSSFNPETDVISVADHAIVGRVRQASPFCPNIAASADGTQVWFTLKDIGETQVFDARPPFALLKTLNTGPITNHVNLVRNAHGSFAYVTVGGLNEVQVFDTTSFAKVATIPVGKLPHGIWPSGDGMRVYVGLENGDAMVAIDTLTNKVVATMPIGQAPQAVRLRAGCRAGRVRHPEPAEAGPRRHGDASRAVGGHRRQAAGRHRPDQRHPVRPGPAAGAAGVRDRAAAEAALRAGIGGSGVGQRADRAARQLHHQPGGFGHRGRGRTDPGGGAGDGRCPSSLPRHPGRRAGRCRQPRPGAVRVGRRRRFGRGAEEPGATLERLRSRSSAIECWRGCPSLREPFRAVPPSTPASTQAAPRLGAGRSDRETAQP